MDNTLTVTSPSFENEEIIPVRHTGRGEDQSPKLRLSPLHEKAISIAIIMDDIGHPIPNYNHWVIWNLPAMEIIPENIPYGVHVDSLGGAVQGCGWGRHRYRGPKPPFNWSHRYQFNVYALDCMLDLPTGTRKRGLLEAMQEHILQYGALIGRFR